MALFNYGISFLLLNCLSLQHKHLACVLIFSNIEKHTYKKNEKRIAQFWQFFKIKKGQLLIPFKLFPSWWWNDISIVVTSQVNTYFQIDLNIMFITYCQVQNVIATPYHWHLRLNFFEIFTKNMGFFSFSAFISHQISFAVWPSYTLSGNMTETTIQEPRLWSYELQEF